jgi:hypothetical protein
MTAIAVQPGNETMAGQPGQQSYSWQCSPGKSYDPDKYALRHDFSRTYLFQSGPGYIFDTVSSLWRDCLWRK